MTEEADKANERFREVAMRLLKEGDPTGSGLPMERMSEEHLKRTHEARLLRNPEVTLMDPSVLQALDDAQERINAAHYALELRPTDEVMAEAIAVLDDEEWNPEPQREKIRRRPAVKRKPERDVVADGISLLRQLGYARKVHGNAFGNAGEPDVDAVVKGRGCKFEAKTTGTKPTPVQLGAMRRWAQAGALVGWFRNNDHLNQLLEHLDDVNFVPDLTQPGCSCPLHQVREV